MKDAKVVYAQAADIKNQERNGGLLKPCPPTFSGAFAAFFKKHAAPNLPGVARVRAFDALLRRHLAAKDPVHVTRFVRGQTRGEICAGMGGRMLPTDNSPVWWIHSFLLSGEALPKDAATFFESLPYRMFGLPKREYLNSAEYHAAHIVNAKDGNVEWRRWTRPELVRRTLVNIHPCNMFLAAKTDWPRWGGNADIRSWVVHRYREVYGAVMDAFLADVGADIPTPATTRGPRYNYGAPAKTKRRRASRTAAPPPDAPVKRLNRPKINKRLTGTGTLLDIHSLGRRFVVPHDALVDWVGRNTKALATPSWTVKGVYSWPKPSKDMLPFLEDFAR